MPIHHPLWFKQHPLEDASIYIYISIISLDVRRQSSRHHWASPKVHGVCGTMVGQAGGVLEGILGAWCLV